MKATVPDNFFSPYYDAWNRLVRVTTGSGESETPVAEYQYDGLNRRIVKATATQTQHFYLSNQNQVLEERVGTDAFANIQNVWGVRYVDDLVLRDRDTSTTRDGVLEERCYALQDANWNTVTIVDSSGAVQERYTYTAYGKCEVLMEDFTLDADGRSDFDWRSLYTAREFDAETGLYYYRARYYDANLGRFISRDPIGYRAGINLYNYVGTSPIVRTDPSGYGDAPNPPAPEEPPPPAPGAGPAGVPWSASAKVFCMCSCSVNWLLSRYALGAGTITCSGTRKPGVGIATLSVVMGLGSEFACFEGCVEYLAQRQAGLSVAAATWQGNSVAAMWAERALRKFVSDVFCTADI